MLTYLVLILLVATRFSTNGECNKCNVPTSVYYDLRCTAIFSDENKCCPIEYDCSHIYNRPKGTCHLKGKYYKPGESPVDEDIAGDCRNAFCTCGYNGLFDCLIPAGSCAEFSVPDYVQPGCYLTYEHNRCCSVDQKCPPFSQNDAKCQVGETIYKEGQMFSHPTEKCTSCICDKTFNGSYEWPLCQHRNCTIELQDSDKIHKYCAPHYFHSNDCCPFSWICPSKAGIFLPPPTAPQPSAPRCRFGKNLMYIGEKYQYKSYTCECVIPPYLTCRSSEFSD